MTRRYTSEIGIIIGPQSDIPAPDVNTNAQIMAWMMDTYSMNTGTTATGVVTGKPLHLGGSLGRVKATGRGVFVTGREAARASADLDGARVAVQGSATSAARRRAVRAGRRKSSRCRITPARAQPTASTGDRCTRRTAASPAQGRERSKRSGTSMRHPDPGRARRPDHEARARIKAKLVLEGANGPTCRSRRRPVAHVLVVPDVICNAGGVTRQLLRVGAGLLAVSSGARTRSTCDSTRSWSTRCARSGTPPIATRSACAPRPSPSHASASSSRAKSAGFTRSRVSPSWSRSEAARGQSRQVQPLPAGPDDSRGSGDAGLISSKAIIERTSSMPGTCINRSVRKRLRLLRSWATTLSR